MKFNTKSTLAAAAMAGLLAGSPMATFAANHHNPAGTQLADAEKGTHACKGHNSCKGTGGCKSGDNGCKGKNSCKGKGGCATDGSKSK